MENIKLAYKDGYRNINLCGCNVKGVLTKKPAECKDNIDEVQIVKNALDNPIGTKTLAELAVGKKNVVVVTSDHTRAMPSKITLPLLLNEIRSGNPDANITILIGTGLHRPTTKDEQYKMFGKDICDSEKIVVHDAFDDKQMQYVKTLPSGAEFLVNKLAVTADLLVCEGFIEPHFFAGFSGGRKSILPGISSAATVNENHSYKALSHPMSKTGTLTGNVISDDMLDAARSVNVAFILNVILDDSKRITAAFAGDLEMAHAKGCDHLMKSASVETVIGDIVVTTNGGSPLDQNLYQCAKASTTAASCAGKDGVIILIAACNDGIGGENFGRLMQMGTPSENKEYLSKIPPKESISEQWCVQKFSDILEDHKIILVSELDSELVERLNMIPAASPDDALAIAKQIKGESASIVVIPDGVAIVTR